MRLIDVLARFGFDPQCKAKMVRHANSKWANLDEIIDSDSLEEFQRWQSNEKIFRNLDFIVSFLGDGAGRAKFFGVYRVAGYKTVPFKQLRKSVPWRWREGQPHHYYDLQPVPGYEPLIDHNFVIEWSSDRSWEQHLKNNAVLKCPPLKGIARRRGGVGKGNRISVSRTANHFADASAIEGLRIEVKTFTSKRSRSLRKIVLDAANGKCEACRVDFSKVLEGDGMRVLQVHHRRQLSQLTLPTVTIRKDLAVVCANCHLLLHLNPKRAMKVERLRKLLSTDRGVR